MSGRILSSGRYLFEKSPSPYFDKKKRKSPAGFITLEVTAEVRIDASQR